jgi:uncharacterized protein YecE (DUF72 family)
MEYGRTGEHLLDKINFSLPEDDPQTTLVLAHHKKIEKSSIHVGCAKWGRPEWIGKIYPPGTKPGDFLEEYAKQFNCIELNSIFYQLPAIKQVKTWKSKVPADFKFCPKFTEVITHQKRLRDTSNEVNAFLEMMDELGENAGPVFLMPHPQMGAGEMDTIIAFLESLPATIKVFVEFRHADFFKEPTISTMYNWLEEHHFGSIITDTAGVREGIHMRLTIPEAFIRFVGNSLHPSDYTRIDDWVERIARWLDEGLQSLWFFMHQHDERYSPELCKYFIEQLNKECGLSVQAPRFYAQQSSLF